MYLWGNNPICTHFVGVTRTMQINEEGYELQSVTNDWAHVWFLWGAGNDEAMLGFTHLGELVKLIMV